MSPELIQKIGCVFEACGSVTLSDGAMEMVVEDLEEYPEEEVSKALDMCRQEVKGRLSLAHIIERIPKPVNSRLSADEAFALLPFREEDSVVWTDEMSEAFGICQSMYDSDEIGCRLAFRDAYNRLCAESEARGEPVRWAYSPGTHKAHRERVLKDAVDKGRISGEHAKRIMPELETGDSPRLPEHEEQDESIQEYIDRLKQQMGYFGTEQNSAGQK